MSKELEKRINISDEGLVKLENDGKKIFFKLSDIVSIIVQNSRYESSPKLVSVSLLGGSKLSLGLSEDVFENLIENYKDSLRNS